MRKFEFNLERLLKLREHEEQEWEIKLGRAVTKCVDIENQIKHRHSEIERVLLNRGSIENREQDFLVMEMYKRRMRSEAVDLNKKLAEAEAERDEVRNDFLEASKKRKVLSKLKEKREKEYYKKQLKNEHELIDEINNGRAAAARNNAVL